MNTLTAAIFACVVVLASAKPSGLYGLGYAHGHGHLPLVGASGVVSSHGAAGPAGVVNGHGAVGPNGIANAVHGHAGVLVGAAHGLAHGHGHLPLVGPSGVVSSHGAAGPAGVVNGHGAVGPNGIPNAVHGHGGVIVGAGHGLGLAVAHGHDDGQWHGEGLLASQDWAGHGSAVAVNGLGLGHGAVLKHGAVLAGPVGAIVGHGVGHLGLGHHGW